MYAQQEYDRIMELVTVLQRQAAGIKRRLDVTDWVHAARYDFQLAHGHTYWLVQDHRKNEIILCAMGPDGWSAAAPEWYEYITAVKWLGDHTWIEVTAESQLDHYRSKYTIVTSTVFSQYMVVNIMDDEKTCLFLVSINPTKIHDITRDKFTVGDHLILSS